MYIQTSNTLRVKITFQEKNAASNSFHSINNHPSTNRCQEDWPPIYIAKDPPATIYQIATKFFVLAVLGLEPSTSCTR